MEKLTTKKKIFQRRIPTLIGIGVMVVGLVVAIVIFGQGTSVFAPRATPATTPIRIKITNVTDRAFSVSFLTSESTTAFIKYGLEPKKLKSQASDDRDQLYGTVQAYPLHHISASGLEPNTTYYFQIGTGGGALFDDNGQPFTVTTARRGGTPPAAKTIYGAVVTNQGGPAKGSIVYVRPTGAGEMSQLVQESGSWAVPLSNARTADGSAYASLDETSELSLLVQGHPERLTSTVTTTIGDFAYGSTITLGQNEAVLAQGEGKPPLGSSPTPAGQEASSELGDKLGTGATSTPSGIRLGPASGGNPNRDNDQEASAAGKASGGLANLLDSEAGLASDSGRTNEEGGEAQAVLDLNQGGDQVITGGSPLIQGKAPAGVVVTVRVNSESRIEQQVTSNQDGQFSLDLEALRAELEPGDHTVEYAYIDPTTGKEVVETYNFTVDPQAGRQLAQANSSPTPIDLGQHRPSLSPSPTPPTYGTDYPYGTLPTPTVAIATTGANASGSAHNTVSTQSALPATESAMPVSGVFTTTLILLLGGGFFILSGLWSFWIAREIEVNE